jgi:hypothetical protein
MWIPLVNEATSGSYHSEKSEVLIQVAHVMSSSCPEANFRMFKKLLRKDRPAQGNSKKTKDDMFT